MERWRGGEGKAKDIGEGLRVEETRRKRGGWLRDGGKGLQKREG